MKPLLLPLLFVATAHAGIIIDGATNNGGFVNATASFNGAPNDWTASSGVWVDSGNSSLTSAPFGADTAAQSRFVQIHNDGGDALTSNAAFSVAAGEAIELSVDYKTAGSGNNTTLTVTLWDATANATYATLGSVSTATPQASFNQVNYTATAGAANTNLRLRFTLSAAGGLGKDIHLDRVRLSGGTLNPPTPPAPIEYATVQQLLPGDSDARIAEKAAKLLPRANQVAWQRQEVTFFVHYGPNAFNGVEWGTGTESPSVFNPSALDATQWVREIKNAGGKMVMLVAKHHDGFCLWPSRYTGHDVAASPWLGGQGDLVRDVSIACQAEGLKFGVYLSPADLYQIKNPSGYYGKNSSIRASSIPGDPATFASDPSVARPAPAGMPVLQYQVDDYNRYFLNQLYELLTDYGSIHEVWFDGANPDSSTTQTYNRTAWYDLIRRLRPEAVIAVKGPDVRWVGNENGVSRTTEWSPLPIPVAPEQHGWGDMTAADLGSRAKLTRGSYLTWYPAEADVPVLHGWFWAPSKTARSASELLNIYFTSVGRNSNLLLNVSPDNRGLVPDNQLAPLRAFSQVVRQTFAADLAAGATAAADTSAATRDAALGHDADLDTWWEPAAGQSTGSYTLTLPAPATFDIVSVQEAIAQRGQRIESLAIDTWESGAWVQRATATTVGHKRLIQLGTAVTSDRVQIRILQSRLEPTLAEVSVHRLAELVTEPTIARSTAGQVTLAAGAGETIRYTLDGSDPVTDSPLYTSPLALPLGGNVKAVAWRANGSYSLPAIRSFGLASSAFIATADTSLAGNPASLAVDGNSATFWHTATSGGVSTAQPHWLKLDLGEAKWVGGFGYLPRQDGNANGIIKTYRCETSADGITWTTAVEGSFANIKNNPQQQTVAFPTAIFTRWLRFVTLEEVNGATFASAAEISVMPGGFDAWKVEKGKQNETSSTGPDGNSPENWRQYALGPASSSAARFEWSGPNAGMRFDRPVGVADVAYKLQASESPGGPWQVVPSILVGVGPTGNQIESVKMAEAEPPAASKRFYRLLYSRLP